MNNKHYFQNIWAVLAAVLLLLACSTDEVVTGVARDADGQYVYTLHMESGAPSFSDTRATASWANGSVVYLLFPQQLGGTADISGTATYDRSADNWTLKASGILNLTSGSQQLPVKAIYAEDASSVAGTVITATPQTSFYNASDGKYTHPNDKDIYVSIKLTPMLWRVNFQGTTGQTLSISTAKSNFQFFTGYDFATAKPSLQQANVSLTVGANGYTPYVYSFFQNPDADNTLTVTTPDGAYKRTVKGSTLAASKSLYCLVPTAANYASAGWETTSAPAPTSFSLDKDHLTYDHNGGSQQFTMMMENSSDSWTASVPEADKDWLSINTTKGNGNVTITVKVEPNVSTSPRSSHVTVAANGESANMTVEQSGATPTLSVNGKTTETLVFTAGGETTAVSVTSNDLWTAASNQSWCTISPTSATGDATVQVTVAKNESDAQRTATVTFTSNTNSNRKAYINITQEVTTTPALPEGTYNIPGTNIIFNMIKVEGGTFLMGAQKNDQRQSTYDSDAANDEQPIHKVTLTDYWIGQTEVTQEVWEAVMGSNPSEFKSPQHPVEAVTYNQCVIFVNKLNTLLADQLGGKKFAMPTEAQWEFAARGGNKTNGYKYAGSNNIADVAFYHQKTGTGPQDVAKLTPNELGIFDMSGNVWEWCKDFYGSYSAGDQKDPTGPATSQMGYVVRGGSWSWSDDAPSCRVSKRAYHRNELNSNELGNVSCQGFRLALK